MFVFDLQKIKNSETVYVELISKKDRVLATLDDIHFCFWDGVTKDFSKLLLFKTRDLAQIRLDEMEQFRKMSNEID